MTRNQMRLSIFAVALVVALGVVGSVQADPVVYSQPSVFPPTTGRVTGSQNDTNPSGFGNFAIGYDNFQFASPTLITGVSWTGAYFDTQSTVTGFTIGIYSSVGGEPGSLLFSQFIAGTANETSVGNDSFGPVYAYDADISGFLAASGAEYWLSIVADLFYDSELITQWGWYEGMGGDGISFQDFIHDGTTRTQDPYDLAFDLTGQVIPEPTSIALFGLLGLVGVRYGLRRRKVAV